MSKQMLPFILRVHFANDAKSAESFLAHLTAPPSVKFMDARVSISSKHIIEVALDRYASEAHLLDQLDRVVTGLIQSYNFDFVGPVCPREGEGSFLHKKPYMSPGLFLDGSHGWRCTEPKCRGAVNAAIRREECSVMAYRDLMLLMNSLQLKKMIGTLSYGGYRQAAKPVSFTPEPQGPRFPGPYVDLLKNDIEAHELGVYKDIALEADKLLRFMAGLNIQDLSIKDQREFKERVNEMMKQLSRVKE